MKDEQIKEIFLANEFFIKTVNEKGEPDLHPYVYRAARALLAEAEKEWRLTQLGQMTIELNSMRAKLETILYPNSGLSGMRMRKSED